MARSSSGPVNNKLVIAPPPARRLPPAASNNTVKAARPLRELPLGGVIKGIFANFWGKSGMKTGSVDNRLPEHGNTLFNAPTFPKFLSYIDPADGYPVIFPLFQARAVESKRIVFPLTQFETDIKEIPEHAKLAVFALNLEVMSLLVKGTFLGLKKARGMTFGSIDIEQGYNTMPPVPGQIYPELAVRKKVEQFSL